MTTQTTATIDLPETQTVPFFAGNSVINPIPKPIPRPGPGQLLLRVKANALCGSERGQFYGGAPIIPGHEAAGIVVAAGENTSTPIGTPGVVFLMDFCQQCRSCKLGFTNQCLAKRADMGFSHDGGYGQYELIHENIFFPIPPEISPTDATLLLDIMGTGGHALSRAQLVRDDIESILVTGAGPIGLAILAMARILLGKKIPILITDMQPYRLKLAEQLGGTPINLTQGPLAEQMKSRCNLPQVDIAVDTAGKTSARQSALDVISHRGALICVGHGEDLSLKISTQIISPERSIIGSEYFRYNELPENLNLLQKHLPYLQQIITHRFPVSEIKHAFELFFQGDTGKVVIEQ